MKNVFFAMALMLIGTFAFANTNESAVIDEANLITSNVIENNLTTHNLFFSFNESQLLQEKLKTKSCTLKGKFTITFPDGEKFTWEGTLTIVGQSCVEFLKDLMKE